ncbi:MAG: iron complex outermembrane receptor protein [Planctomycetota bacterium]
MFIQKLQDHAGDSGMRVTIYLNLPLFLFSVWPCLLSAQHADKLEEVTVTARPAGFQNVDHIAQALTVVSGDELREKVSNSLGETLAQELGVTASDFGQGASRPVIRGLSGARVKIMQDGISSMDVSTVSVDHPVTIDPGHAEQIEILRGPATLLYGSGAFGGLVNVSTNRIPATLGEEFTATLDARFNSVSDAKSVGLRADGDTGSLGLHFDSLIRDSNNYDSANGEILNSAVESVDTNFGLSIIGNKGYFGAAYGRYASEYGIPLDPDTQDEVLSIDQNQDRFELAGEINEAIPGIRNARIRFGYVDYEHTEFENNAEAGTQFFNNEWEGRIELHHQPIGVWNGTFGLQYRNRRFNSVGTEAFVPRSKLDSVGFFILEDRDWHDWHFELGARYEMQTVEPVDSTTLLNVDHDVYSLSLGALWNFSKHYFAGVSLTRAQRAPALEELLANGPHVASGTFEEGDPNLREETSNNIDLSLRKTSGSWRWTANIFVNYIENFIFQQEQDEDNNGFADEVDIDRLSGGELLLIAFRQQDGLFYGIEAESRYEIFDNEKGKLGIRFWGDWVRAQLNKGGDLPRISPARLGSNLEYNRDNWHFDVDLTYTFKQNKVGKLESETGGYTSLNMGLGYEVISGKLEADFSLRASNLLNEDRRRHTSFLKERAPLPGRAVILGLSVSF